jgi:hypothetical protein
MPVILATQEAEIRRIMVRNQPQDPLSKKLITKMASRVAQGVGPECKSQYHQKKKGIFCFKNFKVSGIKFFDPF